MVVECEFRGEYCLSEREGRGWWEAESFGWMKLDRGFLCPECKAYIATDSGHPLGWHAKRPATKLD